MIRSVTQVHEKIKQLKSEKQTQRRFHDALCYKSKFLEILPELKKVPEALLTRAEKVEAFMHDLSYEVNNNQLAVTLAAYYKFNFKNKKRLIFSVPAGHGKSRIIVSLVYAFAFNSSGEHNSFKVVYNHQELLEQDRPCFDKLQEVFAEMSIELCVAQEQVPIEVTSAN